MTMASAPHAENLEPSTPASVSTSRFAARVSLRIRVVIGIVAVAAVIQSVLAAFVYSYFDTTIDSFFADRLSNRMKLAAADLSKSPEPATEAALRTATDQTLRIYLFNTLVLAIRDENGRVLASSSPQVDLSRLPPPGVLTAGAERPDFAIIPGIGTAEDSSVPARALTVTFKDARGGNRILTGAASNLSARKMTTFIGRAVLLASLFGLAATAIATWFITGYALKPLSRTGLADGFTLEQLALPAQANTSLPELESLASQLAAARERIRIALLANERFIANVSHELKTPVAVLRTQAQMLNKQGLTPEGCEFVQSVIDETRRMGAMVDSFLTLSSVRSGQTLTTSTPVFVNDLLLESVNRATATAKPHGVSLNLLLQDMPDDLVVSGNPELLALLFDNLLRNAVRFSPAGKSVDIDIAAQSETISIRITDAGPGISCDLLPRLFDRFSQISAEAIRGRGHGLGLSIAQGIAELHSGLITAENLTPPGSGCRFTVRLPRRKASDIQPTDPLPLQPTAS